MIPDQSQSPMPCRVPVWVQVAAWLLGMLACIAGMLNLIAEWRPGLATIQFLLLSIAPAIWMIEQRRRSAGAVDPRATSSPFWVFTSACLVGLTSLTTCFLVGRDMVDLPPAYHDEYSYLFQAKTLLLGRFSVPSEVNLPELFDQMHVLNEGRMASRYYPGTGLWLAPWVALGHPYWGQWCASALTSILIFFTGYELGRLRVALISGFACALSPGIALFANLLLAHQATLVGLSLFLWGFVRWQRTRSPWDALIAGCGLSFAMICRPPTAASVGLPFGVEFLGWLIFGKSCDSSTSARVRVLAAMLMPLMVGWSIMLTYNHEVTGSWTTSPYQLYTDIYTPRHVYGFNNVRLGEQKLGPKVIESYDRWAINLTPSLALDNFRDRWITSWLWTFDLVPLLMSSVIILGTFARGDRRWISIGLAILSLHAIHIPYWYTGIMGWHYVFESAPLWCLLLALASDLLIREWSRGGRWMMPGWWTLMLLISICGTYLPLTTFVHGSSVGPKISNAIRAIRFPRQQYAEFDRWITLTVNNRPALVLIQADPDDQHMDYVVNPPLRDAAILRGRYRPERDEFDLVVDSFPGRAIYLCNPKRKLIREIHPSK